MYADLEKNIGYHFRDVSILRQALTHSSYSNEKGSGHNGCNERLEFLGDSVLGFVTADYLYRTNPDVSEGVLSHTRAELVCESNLARTAAQIGLGACLLLGKGEKANGGEFRASILEDAFESLIAAVYLDGGFESAKKMIHRLILNVELTDVNASDYKTALQELIQKERDHVLQYRLIDATGPDHNKTFVIAVLLDGVEIGRGTGASKKKAEQAAAKNGMDTLKAE